jgi:hypothetical protein
MTVSSVLWAPAAEAFLIRADGLYPSYKPLVTLLRLSMIILTLKANEKRIIPLKRAFTLERSIVIRINKS